MPYGQKSKSLLIERAIVTVEGIAEKVHVCIHWKGGNKARLILIDLSEN